MDYDEDLDPQQANETIREFVLPKVCCVGWHWQARTREWSTRACTRARTPLGMSCVGKHAGTHAHSMHACISHLPTHKPLQNHELRMECPTSGGRDVRILVGQLVERAAACTSRQCTSSTSTSSTSTSTGSKSTSTIKRNTQRNTLLPPQLEDGTAEVFGAELQKGTAVDVSGQKLAVRGGGCGHGCGCWC